MFHELLERLGSTKAKRHTWYCKSFHTGLRLVITLHLLSTGDSYHSLMYGFWVAHNLISLIVRDVYQAIIDIYDDEVVPCKEVGWHRIPNQFGERWYFQQALGALDGKHVAITRPKNCGSLYYNYKGFHSIILLVLVDGDYKFIWPDIRENCYASDVQVFMDSELRDAINDSMIAFSEYGPLLGDDQETPYFIIRDNVFPLQT